MTEINYYITVDIAGSVVSYQGCYKDDSQSRDLAHKILMNGNNSPQLCLAKCAQLSYAYAGLQVVIIVGVINYHLFPPDTVNYRVVILS